MHTAADSSARYTAVLAGAGADRVIAADKAADISAVRTPAENRAVAAYTAADRDCNTAGAQAADNKPAMRAAAHTSQADYIPAGHSSAADTDFVSRSTAAAWAADSRTAA